MAKLIVKKTFQSPTTPVYEVRYEVIITNLDENPSEYDSLISQLEIGVRKTLFGD
jgi:hypothetical protein